MTWLVTAADRAEKINQRHSLVLSKYLSNIRDICVIKARMLPPRVVGASRDVGDKKPQDFRSTRKVREISSL